MITTQGVDAIDERIRTAIDALPSIVAEMRDTAVDRERLIEENRTLQHELTTLGLTVADLREDKKTMDARIGALLAENAKLEHLLKSIGNAIKDNSQVQDNLALLASQQKNGKQAPVIEHEQQGEAA